MKCTDATNSHRKSGVAQWRDCGAPFGLPKFSGEVLVLAQTLERLTLEA